MKRTMSQWLGDEESLRRWNEERKDAWRDRTAGYPIADLQKFVVGMSKPPWWRFVRRWKWRKMARNMCKPQPGLSGWKVIDCRNAPGHLSDVVFAPELIELTAFTSKDGCSTTVGARYEWDEETKSPGDRETKKEK